MSLIQVLTFTLLLGPQASKPLETPQTSQARNLVAKGDEAYARFDNDKAFEFYEKAYKLDPQNFEAAIKYLRANNNKGQVLRDAKGNREDVEKYFRKNVELAEEIAKKFPDKAEAPFSLAIAYGNLALYSSVREKVQLSQNIEANLKRSIALDSKFPYSYLGLGIFYREVSQITFLERFFANLFFGRIPKATIEDSLDNFETALNLDSKFVFTHYHYARALEIADRIPEAFREYQLVLSMPRSDVGDPILKKFAKEDVRRLSEIYPDLLTSEKTTVHQNN